MKIQKLLFLILFAITITTINSQYFNEQNSGVTSSLNAVCMIGQVSTQQVWVCGSSGVVLKSTNNGTNWVNVSSTVILPNYLLYHISGKVVDTVFAVGSSTGTSYVFRTSNGGTNWSTVYTHPGTVYGIVMKNALHGFMGAFPLGGRWTLRKTTNGGINWDSTGLYLPQSGSELGMTSSVELINNNIWFGTNNSRIYYSSNYGSNWSVLNVPEVNVSSMWHYSLDSSNSIIGGANAHKTTNNGLNWILLSSSGSGNYKGFCSGIVAVVNSPWFGPLFSVREGDNKVFLNWINNQFVTEYTAPSGLYNAVAYGNVFNNNNSSMYSWAVRSNGGITRIWTMRGGAVNRISTLIPETYSLSQNYPNPFNPVTRIKFNIPQSGKNINVRISVYDLLGRETAEIFNGNLSPGEYEAEFNASNLPSGTYFYRLSSNNYSETKKMILVK